MDHILTNTIDLTPAEEDGDGKEKESREQGFG